MSPTAPTELSAASVSVSAGNELNTYGTRVTSGGRVNLQAGGAGQHHAGQQQGRHWQDAQRHGQQQHSQGHAGGGADCRGDRQARSHQHHERFEQDGPVC